MKGEKNISENIVANIVKIRKERDIKQASLASAIEIDPGTYSKIESGKIALTIDRLAEIASYFKMDLIEVIYWPHKYVRYESLSKNERNSIQPKVTVQIELNEEKKKKVLEMVFEGKELELLE
jgi:transcriptional regulator with XRE-family HTH domain